uniref:Uncharacterized protein n=1 Tax=Haptolina ericina TaxID=156174 RepID=A0A7S3B2Z9_9EUKA|eukprot:CAMPEP_0181181262 /NCGR_PEP_ID=MMETSP1096-20121128/7243_1 /TAXON_ID=156174 ORGANISM="Chrysochromulina ericina, Strain CCMP281" /NCGR_SAMPLE_ID=MMETSP1096 /ASSEMBLY_ACC=CAM_ASM_000453 /LENGTH=94 /DNA_ID=CAMNT_0023269753 /DNA_START=40 /DNA_END=324 /DNA_ORIENTATION=-
MTKKKVKSSSSKRTSRPAVRSAGVTKPARLKEASDLTNDPLGQIIIDAAAEVTPYSEGPTKSRTKHSKVKRSISRKKQKVKTKAAARKQRRKGM